jgi:hypothetical protein
MKSIIFTVLFICLISFLAFAQSEPSIKDALKIDETGVGYGCDWNARITNLKNEQFLDSEAIAIIIAYKGISERPTLYVQQLKIINREMVFIRADKSKIQIIDGGFRENFAVEIWIVPKGAKNPKPSNYMEKITNVGVANNRIVASNFQKLFEKLKDKEISIGYIVNFGSKKQKLLRIKQINNAINSFGNEQSKIVISDGGYSKKLNTEFWTFPLQK